MCFEEKRSKTNDFAPEIQIGMTGFSIIESEPTLYRSGRGWGRSRES